MTIYEIKLKNRTEVAKDTMSFTFEKPTDFAFRPGQFGRITLKNPPQVDAEGNMRAFSISSPPYSDDLEFTTRMRETAFKNSLAMLPIGTTVRLDAPHGSFFLHRSPSIPAVFIAGGIGVTPVKSILLQAAHDKLSQKLFLFYSNHTPESAAFLEEFRALEKQNPNFKFVPTMTSMPLSKKPSNGETSHVDRSLLSKYIDDLSKPIYYISGSSAMVTALREKLVDEGMDEDKIRSEEFSGY